MNQKIRLTALTVVVLIVSVFAQSEAQAQGAKSWVDLLGSKASAGASFDGLLGHATSTASRGDVDTGHGFSVGLGQNGITLSNSIGVGKEGIAGIGHNVQLNLNRNGMHVSRGAVISRGGETQQLRVGGQTRTIGGRPTGGSQVIGSGSNSRGFSNSFSGPRGSLMGRPILFGRR
jgi:hypothetical protein